MRCIIMKKFINYSLAILFSMCASAQMATAQYTIPSKMSWWYEARFGMFIHFGSYSYLGHGEWAFATENWTKANYQPRVSAKFNPAKFDAGIIARLAKKAGMKYLVITAKHHEGFSMWQTAVQSFKDVTGTKLYDLPDFTNFGTRDVLKELKDSCDVQGVKFCLYYSILDWNHSSQTINQNYSTMASDSARTAYINDMKAQLSELITKYHPPILWFDGDWTYNAGAPTPSSWWTKSDGADLYDYLISLDSTLIINERVARGFGLGDFENPENMVPNAPLGRPWETCRTMNSSWGYASWDNNYKTPTTLIQEMVKTVSRDGNYLLNIGPKGDGTVPDQSVAILNSFGDWMNIYSESIYGTTRSPYRTEPHWGVYTKKAGKLYAHVFTWPADGLLRMPSLTNAVNKIYLMNDTTAALSYTDSLGCTTISVPANAPNAINSVVVVEVSGVPSASTQYVKVNRITVKSARGVTTISSNGDTLQMSATIAPSSAAIKSVTWSISNTTIASINSGGLLTAKSNGKVDVVASANDGTGVQGKIQITISGQTAVDDYPTQTPPGTPVLNQNYPNPFNPVTSIQYSVGSDQFVSIKVFDVLGNEVATLVNEKKPAGVFHVSFEATGIASGIYFYRMKVGEFVSTRKMLLVR